MHIEQGGRLQKSNVCRPINGDLHATRRTYLHRGQNVVSLSDVSLRLWATGTVPCACRNSVIAYLAKQTLEAFAR